jgi:SAM-dependent methyltransferase
MANYSLQSEAGGSESRAPLTPKAHGQEHFCNLCQQHRFCGLLYRVQGQEIVRCNECQLVFMAPEALSASQLARLYSQEYFEGGLADGYTDYSASEETLRRQARRLLRRLRRYQPDGALLELGCAYGFFLLEARAFFEAKGVEISTFAAEQARRRGLDVLAGDFQALSFPSGSCSVVCLFDCIEHLANPFAYLQKINSALRPQGIVALTTGDIGSLYARLSGRRWRLMTPPQHLFFFSRATLTSMLEKAGFQVIEVSYPWKIVPWRLVLYQLSPRLKAVLGPIGRLPLSLYVNLFDAMFVIARKV